MRKVIIVPAVFVGCVIVIGLSSIAAAHMPPQISAMPVMAAGAEILPETKEANIDQPPLNNPEPAIKDCSLSARYPNSILQWCFEIEAAAQETGLPSNLIAAVILQESGGDPGAYSSSGAVGLMQIMPRDGIAADFMCINGPCFSSRPTITELEDPVFNLNYGSRMLAGLTSKYGSYREALFHYGPMDMGFHYADLVLKIWENYE